jgi:hypothetical protein
VLVGLRDRGLDLTHLAEALQEALGHRAQLVRRSRKHRVDCAAIAQRAQNLAMQPEDLGQHLLAGLIDVAMDQVLQAARLALQLDQELVGFAHLADIVPGAAENIGAVPDQRREDHRNRGIERRHRQQAPPDRQHPDHALGLQIKASPRPRARRSRLLLGKGDQIETH